MSVLHINGVEPEILAPVKPAQLISPHYAEQNRLLHEQIIDYGRSGQMWAKYVERLVTEEKYATILDYGCGKGTLAKALPKMVIAEYDPAIPGKQATPAPAELVICTDVLEHIEPALLHNVLADLARVTQKKLFFNIALRPAKKTLPDGRNTHLIQESPTWWFDQLKQHFTITLWEVRPKVMVYGEAMPGGGFTGLIRKQGYKRRNREERRRIEKEMAGIVKLVMDTTAKYADELSRVRTAEQWEPWDDITADMLVCGGVLNQLDPQPGPMGSELQRAMTMLCLQARIAVCLVVPLDPYRNEGWWKEFLSKYLMFSDWMVHNGCVYCVGGPVTKVQGIKTIQAGSDLDLWAQVKTNIARIPKRIPVAPAHGRRAIIACYGPSLGDYLFKIAEENAQGDADILSVSGAHDFLIRHAIRPRYHIECDPRPHKADNIERGVAGVEYLMASVVHPNVFDKLEGCDVALWHVAQSDFVVPLVDELKESGKTIISGGGSVGLRSLPLLYALGYREFSVYAMDCSFAEEGNKQWAGKHAGKIQDVTTCTIKDKATGENRTFYTSPVLMTYAANMMDEMRKMVGCGFRVYGDGLLPAMVRYHYGNQGETLSGPESKGD